MPGPGDEVSIGGQQYAGRGRVYVFSGADGTMLTVIDAAVMTSEFGSELATIDDVTNDDVDDLVIAQRGRTGIYAGVTGAARRSARSHPASRWARASSA